MNYLLTAVRIKEVGPRVSTEDLVHMLHEMGIETNIALQALIGCAKMLEELLDHEWPGQVMKAGICGHLTEAS